jgi:hypothetical protein
VSNEYCREQLATDAIGERLVGDESEREPGDDPRGSPRNQVGSGPGSRSRGERSLERDLGDSGLPATRVTAREVFEAPIGKEKPPAPARRPGGGGRP